MRNNTPELVAVVNRNGRIGHVAASYPPLVAGLLRRAPEALEATADPDSGLTPEAPDAELLQPARNARTETWQDYARAQENSGLSPEQIDTMSRDALVAHFTE